MFLSGDIERRNECRKAQFRHFVIELFRQEVDIVLVSLKPARSPPGRRGDETTFGGLMLPTFILSKLFKPAMSISTRCRRSHCRSGHAVLQHLHVDQFDDVETTRRGSEDIGLRHGALHGCHLEPPMHACRARLDLAAQYWWCPLLKEPSTLTTWETACSEQGWRASH